MITVVVTCLIGVVFGLIGRMLLLRDNRGGMLTVVVLAITGAMSVGMAGWLMDWFPQASVTSYLASAAGAVLAMNIYSWSEGKAAR